jgi:predicted Fe-Mo cluster-binding NifX family protein
LASRRIQVVLPNSRGPKAFEELQAAGIEVVLNPPGRQDILVSC